MLVSYREIKDFNGQIPHSQRATGQLDMELIDVMHFVFNACLAIGVTPQEFYNYYLSKNEENWNRQENNY